MKKSKPAKIPSVVAPKRTSPKSLWKDHYAIDAFEGAMSGKTNAELATLFGVEYGTFVSWSSAASHATKPLLIYALAKGRELHRKNERDSNQPPGNIHRQTLDYIYQHLPDDLKPLWEEIEYWSDHANGYQKLTILLNDKPTRIRQHLFVHAMVATNFDASAACKMVCLSKAHIDKWKEEDPNFPRLLEEIEWHKKNFFEKALIDMVQMRDSRAVVHVNKTLNSDRGYGEKSEVTHKGQVNHSHNWIPIDQLELDLETRTKVLAAMRKLQARIDDGSAPAALPQRAPIDV